jgi:hypothetical protein
MRKDLAFTFRRPLRSRLAPLRNTLSARGEAADELPPDRRTTGPGL